MNPDPVIPPELDPSYEGEPSLADLDLDEPSPFYDDELQFPAEERSRHTGTWDPEDDHELLGAEEAALHIEPEA